MMLLWKFTGVLFFLDPIFWGGAAAAASAAALLVGILFYRQRVAAPPEAVRDRLEMFHAVIDNLPGFFFVKDVEDNFRYIMSNHGHEEVIGLSMGEIVGRFDTDLFAFDDEAKLKIEEEDRRLLGGEVLDTVDVFVNRKEKLVVVRTIKKVITRADGSRLMVGMGVDVTRQHQLEQEQLRTIETLNGYIGSERIINQLLTRITLEENFELAVHEMLRIIGEHAGADRCCLFKFTDDTLTQASCDFEWIVEGIPSLMDSSPNIDMSHFGSWQETLLDHRSIILSDLTQPPPGLELPCSILRSFGLRSLLGSGIWIDNRLYGFLGVDFIREVKNFTDREAHMIDSLVNLFRLAFERSRQREQLLESVSLQRQIMDNISLPITIIDLDYKILAANPSAVRDAGVPLEELLGTRCCDTICRFGEPPEFCPVRETLLTRQPCRKEHDFKDMRQISTAQPIFDRNGNMPYILTLDIDITEMTRQKKELLAAMEQAQAADRAKSTFLATVSHELRTPLNAVIGFSELLQHEDVDPALGREYLRSINFAGTALLNLVNDVLDLSKLEADQMTIQPSENDVAELVREVAAVFKLKCIEKNLKLRVEVGEVRHRLYVDNLRLRQILLNLLGNAVKFTSSGMVSLEASFLPDGEETGMLQIRVSDTGIGISEEARRTIFDPFMQDNVTRGKRVYEGSGLGLAITKRLLDRMGGSIELDSKPGKGCVFTVRLGGVRYVREAEKALLPAPEPSAPAAPLEKRRMLLVDDVPLNLKVLAAMLKRRGVECALAASAEEAVAILRSDRAFDAILTDMWMPGESGSELAQRIRGELGLSGLPIWAVTADTQVAPEDAALFDGILYKPLSADALDQLFQRISS